MTVKLNDLGDLSEEGKEKQQTLSKSCLKTRIDLLAEASAATSAYLQGKLFTKSKGFRLTLDQLNRGKCPSKRNSNTQLLCGF
jgi:hypothetical protein